VQISHSPRISEAWHVDLFLEQQAIDTTTPAGRLMFQVCGAFAEFERSMIRQRVKLGLKRAVAQGKRLGRPKIGNDVERKVQRQLRKGAGILKVAKLLGLRPLRNWRRPKSRDAHSSCAAPPKCQCNIIYHRNQVL
jgi:DNA invertase Pin-like site-specific DNA recombinase